MATIVSGVAELIGTSGINGLRWNPVSGGGSVYADVVPPKPDLCVVVTLFGGDYEYASGLSGDRLTTVQIRVRAKHTGTASVLAARIGDLLWGTRDGAVLTLADTQQVDVVQASVEGPVFMGIDTNERPEYVLRYNLRWSSRTPVTPAEAR